MRITGNQMAIFGGSQKREQQGVKKKSSIAEQIKSLTEQKELIAKKKTELIAKNEQDGGDMGLIKEQLANYEQQLKTIDSQISEIQAKQIKEQKENLGKEDKNNDSNQLPQSTVDSESEKINKLSTLGTQLQRIDQTNQIKSNTEQNAKITLREIETDNGNRASLLARIEELNPGASEGMISIGAVNSKYQTLSELEDRVGQLNGAIGKKLGQLNGAIGKKLGELTAKVMEENTDTGKVGAATADEKDSAHRLEAEYGITEDFLNEYEQWQKDAEEMQLDKNQTADYLLERIAQWTQKLSNQGEDKYQTWKTLVNGLDCRA